jgi:hypothetical protein
MTPRPFLRTPQVADHVRASSEPAGDVVRDHLVADPRWETVLLPVSDGPTLVRRR